MSNLRYELTWEPGLCRHGCGWLVVRPQNSFINGHDGKLMDILVDAQREGAFIVVRAPHYTGPDRLIMYPRDWAEQAFSPDGLAHFDSLVLAPDLPEDLATLLDNLRDSIGGIEHSYDSGEETELALGLVDTLEARLRALLNPSP